MKKTLFILSTIMVFAVLTPSCKKDSASTNSNDLSGTVWVNRGSTSGINVVETITFTSSTAFTDVAVLTGATNTTLSVSGSYTYSSPTVKFTTTTGTNMSGTINGTNMFAPSANGSAVVTYVKQ